MKTLCEYLALEGLWGPFSSWKSIPLKQNKKIAQTIERFQSRGKPTIISVDQLQANQKTIDGIVSLYFDDNIKLAPTGIRAPHLNLPVDDVARYSTYSRARGKTANMGFDKQTWDRLVASIKKEGIKAPIDIQISPGGYVDFLRTGHIPARGSDDVPPVGLLTGNNRIVIAKEIGLETVPVKFHYGDIISNKDIGNG